MSLGQARISRNVRGCTFYQLFECWGDRSETQPFTVDCEQYTKHYITIELFN